MSSLATILTLRKFEEEYASDKDDEDDEDEDSNSVTSAPELVNTRDDFEAVMDEFLAQEQVGKKLQQKIGNTPMERLNTMRRALVDDADENEALARREALLNRLDDDGAPIPMPVDLDERKERWDCETILSTYSMPLRDQVNLIAILATYSNLENHPRLLRLTQPRAAKKIRLDPRTGLPSVVEAEDVEPPEVSESEESEDAQSKSSA